jgi:hypothetical protein
VGISGLLGLRTGRREVKIRWVFSEFRKRALLSVCPAGILVGARALGLGRKS